MYTQASTAAMKQMVMSLFTKPGSTLRIVIATVDIDCPDVHQIIHWDVPLLALNCMFKKLVIIYQKDSSIDECKCWDICALCIMQLFIIKNINNL